MPAPRVDLGADGDLFVGEDLRIDMEVIDASSMIDAVGRPVPADQWIPLDVTTGYTFRYDLREAPDSATAKIAVDCTIVGVYNANRALNTQRVRATITDEDVNGTGAGNVGAKGGLFWYSFKRTNDGGERIALWGHARFTRATQA